MDEQIVFDREAIARVIWPADSNNTVRTDEHGNVLTADQEARTEIVKLKQEVAELRAAIERIDAAVFKDHDGNYSPTLKPLDDGWGHAEDGWPWDVSVTDSIAAAKCDCGWNSNLALAVGSSVGWWCPVHGRMSPRSNS